MDDWTASQVKEIMHDMFETERRYYDDKIESLRNSIDLGVKNVERALLVYPTAENFKELETRVTVEFAVRDGKIKTIATLLSIVMGGLGVWVSYLTYVR